MPGSETHGPVCAPSPPGNAPPSWTQTLRYHAAFTTGQVMQPGYNNGAEFEFGLDQILKAVGDIRDRD